MNLVLYSAHHRPCRLVTAAVVYFFLWAAAFTPAAHAADQKPGSAAAKNPDKPAKAAKAAGNNSHSSEGTKKWKNLFDGKSLSGWKVTDFAGKGDVTVEGKKIVLGTGVMTGITWTNSQLHRLNYEISLEAMRVAGSDFFCGLTFPVGKDPCSLIVGGWGGGVVGLSNLDGQDASENETTHFKNFENGRWFKIRLKVTKKKIQAWIDAEKVVDVDLPGRELSIRFECEESKPLGISSWYTTAALRNIKVRPL